MEERCNWLGLRRRLTVLGEAGEQAARALDDGGIVGARAHMVEHKGHHIAITNRRTVVLWDLCLREL